MQTKIQKEEFKIIFIGDTDCGKTKFVSKIVDNIVNLEIYTPTIGSNSHVLNGRHIKQDTEIDLKIKILVSVLWRCLLEKEREEKEKRFFILYIYM